jgi:hypothetical protein
MKLKSQSYAHENEMLRCKAEELQCALDDASKEITRLVELQDQVTQMKSETLDPRLSASVDLAELMRKARC